MHIKFFFLIVTLSLSFTGVLTAQELVILDPSVDYVFDRGAVIVWKTNIPASSEIEYGLADNYGEVGTSPIGLTDEHSVTLYQLEPNTLYHCRIRSTNEVGDVAYSNDMTFTTTVAPDFSHASSTTGNDYQVGPGKAYENIGDVPWENLGPGDTVRIFWREAPYKEKFRIDARGTAEAPIRIFGIPGPNGERPVIDGKDATTRPQLNYISWNGGNSTMEDYATVIISAPFGNRSGYILLDSLSIRGAYEEYSYTATNGSIRNYLKGAAPLRIQRGDNIVIRNCELTDGSNGLFVSDASINRELLIEGNYIHNNGSVGSDREHGSYVQGLGVIYRFNHYGPMRPGSGGSSLKDRSSGTVIAYNWIEGGARILDLVEGEGIYHFTTRDVRYRKTYVYGNILQVGEQGGIIHYGGDNGNSAIYRKGTLYFFNNTLYATDSRWRTTTFDLSTNDETAKIFNNILYREGTSKFQILKTHGLAHLGPNWISTGWERSRDNFPFEGELTGTENLIVDSTPPFDLTTFLLKADSIAENTGIPIPSEVINDGHNLSKQINTTLGSESFPLNLVQDRIINGGAIDLGATEIGLPNLPDQNLPDQILSVTPSQNSTNVALDVDLIIELTSSVEFNWTTGGEVQLYKSGVIEPIWTYDPAGAYPEANPSESTPDSNLGSNVVTFNIPSLSPNTRYYVLTGGNQNVTWARINSAPWVAGNFVDPQTWHFETGSDQVSSELNYFNWLSNYDSSLTGDNASPEADPNNNGVKTLLEYAFDFDSPSSSVDNMMPAFSISDDGTNKWATLVWRQNSLASDLIYNVEYSYNLSEWFPINNKEIEFIQTVLDPDPDEDSSAILNQIQVMANEKLFLRIKTGIIIE